MWICDIPTEFSGDGVLIAFNRNKSSFYVILFTTT